MGKHSNDWLSENQNAEIQRSTVDSYLDEFNNPSRFVQVMTKVLASMIVGALGLAISVFILALAIKAVMEIFGWG